MRKKFIGVYALMAVLALGTTVTSCVDDNESASVTAIRDAKAKQLEALANLKNAEAEVQKAEALYKQAETAQIEQATAQEKAEFEAKIESLRAQYEAQLQLYKQQIAQNEALFRGTLYQNFVDANDKLKELEGDYIEAQLSLAEAKAGIKTAEALAKEEILKLDEEIARNNAMIEAYKALPANSHDELLAQINTLTIQIDAKNASLLIKQQAKTDASNAFDDSKVAYDGDNVNGVVIEPTLKVGVAIKDINSSTYSQILSWEDVTPSEAENYSSISKASLNEPQVANVRRQLELNLANAQTSLGKSDDKTDAGTTYARYNADKKAMDDAKKAWEDLKNDPDALLGDIANAEQGYISAERTYLEATEPYGYLTLAQKAVDSADEILKEFEANVKLFDAAGQDYKDYVDAINKTIEAGKAYDKAYHDWEIEKLEYAELFATRTVAQGLLNGNPDIDVKIAQCEAAIAEAEAKKVVAGSVAGTLEYYWYPRMADVNYVNSLPTDPNQGNQHVDNNGHVVNVGDYLDSTGCWVATMDEAQQLQGFYMNSQNVEAFLKECELEVEHLKAEIEAQKLIVEQCKAELEAGINNGTVETPAE